MVRCENANRPRLGIAVQHPHMAGRWSKGKHAAGPRAHAGERLIPPWEPRVPVADASSRRQVVGGVVAHRRITSEASVLEEGLEALTIW
jgi:hypothetical protein